MRFTLGYEAKESAMNATDRTERRLRSDSQPTDQQAGTSVEGVKRATGRSRGEWFSLLDAWGAGGRQYRELADWLTSEHGLSSWWAQKLIVEYEQARGLRPPGVRPDGTFEVSASKTVGVPVERVFAAFVDSRRRKGWLPDADMALRSSERGRIAHFDWDGGASRVSVSFEDKGASRATVAVSHRKIGDAAEAQTAKAAWQQRLAALKSYLER